MEISPHLLYALMFAVAALLTTLGLVATLVNIDRSRRDRGIARRVAAMRPQVLDALDGGPNPNLEGVRRGRETLTFLALGLLPVLRGGERERLSRLLEECGLVNAALLDLHGRSAVRRARAADLLGRASVQRSAPELIRLLGDRDGDVRQTAARALGLIGNSAAVPALLRTMEEGTVPLNTSTMAILRMDRGARAPLIDGLRAESELVRAMSAELLGRLGAVSALPELSDVVTSDPSLEVRIRAVRALGLIGAPGSVDALATAMGSRQPVALRAVATRALGRVGGPRTITLLRGALDAPEHVVAMNAAQALAALGDEGEEVLNRLVAEGTTRGAGYAREGLSQAVLSRSRRGRA